MRWWCAKPHKGRRRENKRRGGPQQRRTERRTKMLARSTAHLLATLPPRLSSSCLFLCPTTIMISSSFPMRSVSQTKNKKFSLEGTWYDPVLRQHEMLAEHLSPKFYPGDTTLDQEYRTCEDLNKPFLLNGRESLLTQYQESVPRKWVEGVVPPRDGMTVPIFLRTLGRGCDEHIDKFPEWEYLFVLKSIDMKLLGIPIAQRRWILHWVEEYRRGRDPVYINKHKSKSKRNLKKKKAGELK